MPQLTSLLVVNRDTGANNEALRERALSLATKTQARVTVVDVMEQVPADLTMRAAAESVTRREPIFGERMSQLAEFVRPIESAGVEVRSEVLCGEAISAIIREVVYGHHDMVLLPAESEERHTLRFLSTSFTRQFTRLCPCPVLIVHPRFREYGTDNILAAVGDLTLPDGTINPLNIKIMEHAVWLARMLERELHIIHTWRLYGDAMLGSARCRGYRNEVAKAVATTQDMQQQRLNELLQHHDMTHLKHQIHLLYGNPEDLVPQFAKALHVDLIVMGTVGRTGLSGVFIGNTAETVLRTTKSSMLLLKPDDFSIPAWLYDEALL